MTDKQWYFDPGSPASVPPQLLPVLEEKGIPQDHIKLCFASDLNRDMIRCENYILCTDSDIMVISGSMTLTKKAQSRFSTKHSLQRQFEVLTYDCFDLADLADFRVEEQIASARFTAKNKDGRHVLISNLSNTYKGDFNIAGRYLGQLKDNGEIKVDDEKRENWKDRAFCPKCGSKYIDEERKLCPKCMDKNKVIRRTGEFILKYKASIVAMIAMLVLTSALGVISPYISSGFYYDEVLNTAGKFYGEILMVLGIIISMRIFSLIINMFHNIVTSKIAARLVYDLKKVIFASIERLSLSFFTNRQTGGLMTQVTRDANTIYWFFCDGVPYFLVNIVQIIAIVIIMLLMNPLLTLLSLVTAQIVFIAIRLLFDHMGKYHAKRWTRSRQMNAVLSDVLTGMRVVKAFSKEKDEITRFGRSSEAMAEAEKNASVFSTAAFPSVNLLFYISNLIVLGFGGWAVVQGEMTYGTLLVFTSYMNMIYSPMYSFVNMVYECTDSLNAMSRLIEIMDAKPDVVEAENPVHITECAGKVEFRNVDFSYDKNRKVIDNVSFNVEAGEALGIVGHTGAGKSTLANLLIRLYEVDNGEILIDGINVKELAMEDLRKNVAIVSQETYLFVGTILDNIRYAKPDAAEDEVIEAAKIAGAHDFIIKLPDAYSTMIGFGYKDLSGGERHRVSIARALLRNPKILILDEATAAMDTETERKIQDALEKLSKGRTTITIAHRLSTLRDADKLIVIENGKVPEAGTHLELINKKGIYYNLYRLQLEAMKNIGIEE
ncbi:MAG: ATP-binding cassette domain-containing protein [Clostridia bacterium]|nr:ATP-binding cassette domain-containing protein [Clostridia bacterium]